MPTATSRKQVRHGIAAYFGGTWVDNIRAYQNGPLASAGLSTVRAGQGKRLNLAEYVAQLPAGRGMGAQAFVQLPREQETRRAMGGPPATDSSGAIIAGGMKLVRYQPSLWVFHLAETAYAEDAQDDVDDLIEAVKQQIRLNRTLGMPGVIYDAGNTPYGIRTNQGDPVLTDKNRVATYFQVQFECMAQILA